MGLNVLRNNFDSPIKLFSNLYPAKFLDSRLQQNHFFCVSKRSWPNCVIR